MLRPRLPPRYPTSLGGKDCSCAPSPYTLGWGPDVQAGSRCACTEKQTAGERARGRELLVTSQSLALANIPTLYTGCRLFYSFYLAPRGDGAAEDPSSGSSGSSLHEPPDLLAIQLDPIKAAACYRPDPAALVRPDSLGKLFRGGVWFLPTAPRLTGAFLGQPVPAFLGGYWGHRGP